MSKIHESPSGFSGQVFAALLVARLFALAIGLIAAVRAGITPHVLLCLLAIAATSLWCLLYSRVLAFVVHHPSLVLLDVLLIVTLIAGAGAESALVFATYPTAFIVGLLTTLPVAIPLGAVLVAGYLFACLSASSSNLEFAIIFGPPLVYMMLIALGCVVRIFHAMTLKNAQELAQARELVAAADERARLAREMHDSLGKTLYGISLSAAGLESLVFGDPDRAAACASDISDAAVQAANESRQLLLRLRTDDLGRSFADVVRSQVETWARENTVECELDLDECNALGATERYELSAILAESLENVHRHAKASLVVVRLRAREARDVSMEIRDNGVGFDPQTTDPTRYGLLGLRERAELISADLEILSSPGTGTTISVSLARSLENNVTG